MKQALDNLLRQEMDRREFLMRAGMAVLGLTGVISALKTMSGSNVPDRGRSADRYGGGAYGGDRTAASAKQPRQLG